MERSKSITHFEELLEVPKTCTLAGLDEYVSGLLKTTANADAKLREFDNELALVQNHIQLICLHLKQRYILCESKSASGGEQVFYTKQEIANMYRVSVRTVTNWIIDGLDVEVVGGTKRISKEALQEFRTSKKGKKFHWRSIGAYRKEIIRKSPSGPSFDTPTKSDCNACHTKDG